MDKVRFILGNGAGRQVDVTVYINVNEWVPEGEEEESDAENSDEGSFLLNNLNIGFTDLSGAAIGQTTGDKITLDTDAAGHGWFIDYTPYLDEEWLPTGPHGLGGSHSMLGFASSPQAVRPIVLAQARKRAPRVFGRCVITPNGEWTQMHGITLSFGAAAVNYMGIYDNGGKYHSEEQIEALRQAGDNAKITIIQAPKHGQLINNESYIPEDGYFGRDKVVARVELASGEKVTVVYFIYMDPLADDRGESIRRICGPKGEFWKISLSPDTTNAVSPLGSLNVTFSDLSGFALAQTTGTGKPAGT